MATKWAEAGADLDARRLLWCMVCGASREASADDFLRYSRQGWPRCCGVVMSYFSELMTEDAESPEPARKPSRG